MSTGNQAFASDIKSFFNKLITEYKNNKNSKRIKIIREISEFTNLSKSAVSRILNSVDGNGNHKIYSRKEYRMICEFFDSKRNDSSCLYAVFLEDVVKKNFLEGSFLENDEDGIE